MISGASYLSNNDMRAHFGLGDNTTVDEVEIHWPSGVVEKLHSLPPIAFLPWKKARASSANSAPCAPTEVHSELHCEAVTQAEGPAQVKWAVSSKWRVSTLDQHPETQLYELRQMAARRSSEIVPEYTDRIARSVKHFLGVLDDLNRVNVEFVSFREKIDTA